MERTSLRYQRIQRVPELAKQDTESFSRKTVAIVGCGALGSATAMLLARMGVGTLRLIDRDVVEEANLSDQILFTESDARRHLPKADTAARAVSSFNSTIRTEPRVADFSCSNAVELTAGCDIIVDALDNMEGKYLINDIAVSSGISWVYGGCAGPSGAVMAVVPQKTHCLRCVWPAPPDVERVQGCETMGVLPQTIMTTASLQATEVLKLLLGLPVNELGGLVTVDPWKAYIRKTPLPSYAQASKSCPACKHRRFPFLNGEQETTTEVLCGSQAVLLRPFIPKFDFERVKSRIAERYQITERRDCINMEFEKYTVYIFPSGRVVVHGTGDVSEARALCTKLLNP